MGCRLDSHERSGTNRERASFDPRGQLYTCGLRPPSSLCAPRFGKSRASIGTPRRRCPSASPHWTLGSLGGALPLGAFHEIAGGGNGAIDGAAAALFAAGIAARTRGKVLWCLTRLDLFAEQTFKQLEGFGSYGFPESHAASVALIAYASSWVKCWHPDVFCAALLNSQPMGFYAPAQIVRDAQAHGVEIRPICINASRWDCTLEPADDEGLFAVRLGMRMVKGLANAHAASIVAARADRASLSVDDLWRRAGVPSASLVRLAEADAFRPALGLVRREALWAIKALRDEPLPLFAAAAAREDEVVAEINEPTVALRPMTAGSEVVQDYGHVGLSLRRYPVAFLRDDLAARRIVTCTQAMDARDGRWLEAAGLVLVRQRPGSAKGVMFITLEDETGSANLAVWPQVFEKFRRVVMGASMIAVRGRIQREGEVVHLVALRLVDLSQPSAAATRLSLCRMDAAIKLHMPAAAPIRASCRPRACAHATSMFRTCTSTSSKRRAGTSIEPEGDGRCERVRDAAEGERTAQPLAVQRRCFAERLRHRL